MIYAFTHICNKVGVLFYQIRTCYIKVINYRFVLLNRKFLFIGFMETYHIAAKERIHGPMTIEEKSIFSIRGTIYLVQNHI